MQIIKECRVCGSRDIVGVLDLGNQPYANSLLKKPDEPEALFPLSISWCPECNLVQLDETAEPTDLFSSYLWVTATSKGARDHAQRLYRDIAARVLQLKQGYVLEVASNDGTFLQPFAANSCRVLGVDPAANIAEMANAEGIPTVCRFFGMESAREIMREHGPAAVVMARNVMPHVANLHDFVRGLGECLADDGLLVIECHYARTILEELHYDSIYHEHLCYFTVRSVEALLERYGLYVNDISVSPISGGSLILYVKKSRDGERPIVREYREAEAREKTNDLASWQDFARRAIEHREKLTRLLEQVTAESGPIAGYGASARSSTMLNFCGIDKRYLFAIADQNPLKQGLYTAGTHIPILGPEKVMEQVGDCVLILAWNFADEIRGILRDRFGYRGKCILPLPGDPVLVDV